MFIKYPDRRPMSSVEGTAVENGVGAVERCYREQSVRLWRALLLYTGNRDVASDAVSEAFAQMIRRGEAVREPDRWVWRAAFNIAKGELARSALVGHGLPDMPVEMPAPTVDLVRALGRLSTRQRAALVLRHYAGYSNRETAAIIGSTPAAVAVHLQRGRRRLGELLEERDD
jgi:RNA polymerase sigma factor (sigma-70 family)